MIPCTAGGQAIAGDPGLQLLRRLVANLFVDDLAIVQYDDEGNGADVVLVGQRSLAVNINPLKADTLRFQDRLQAIELFIDVTARPAPGSTKLQDLDIAG